MSNLFGRIRYYICITMSITALVQTLGDDMQFKAKSGVQSRYIGKQGLMLYDAPVMVNEVMVTKGGIYGGLCNVAALESSRYGKFGNEIDLKVGCRKIIWPRSGHWSVTADLCASYFILGDWSLSRDDRPIVDVQFELSRMPYVQPYVAFRYFGSLTDATSDGWFAWLGFKRDQPLGIKLPSGELRLSTDLSLAFAAEGSFGREGGFIFGRLQTSLHVPLSKCVNISPYYMVQVPSRDQTGAKGDYTDGVHHVFGAFVSAKF